MHGIKSFYGNIKMRFVSWNLLSPELLIRFWRDSYGLPLLSDNNQYDQVNYQRIMNITKVLENLEADIICLQEISTNNLPGLGMPVHHYIAQRLGFIVAAESFKNNPFLYNYPPNENSKHLSIDSGVCILIRPSVQLINTMTAETTGPSTLFQGTGSPFITTQVLISNTSINLSTVHIRIKDGHVYAPIEEYLRKNGGIDFSFGIIMGDFNSSIDPNDLARTGLVTLKHPMPITDDDQMFIGDNIRGYSSISSELLLHTNADPGQAAFNWDLIQEGRATSDHPFMIFDM